MAANSTIQVTPELLRNEGKNIRRIKSDHDTQMNNLFRIVRSLENNWKGKSQDAYVQNFEAMKPVFEKFSKMLEEYAALMDLSAAEMESKDTELASKIARSNTFN
jgi:WXG100 family type VII secretion target